jgi:hypothetical protein
MSRSADRRGSLPLLRGGAEPASPVCGPAFFAQNDEKKIRLKKREEALDFFWTVPYNGGAKWCEVV